MDRMHLAMTIRQLGDWHEQESSHRVMFLLLLRRLRFCASSRGFELAFYGVGSWDRATD